jgi:hypothetical protein
VLILIRDVLFVQGLMRIVAASFFKCKYAKM